MRATELPSPECRLTEEISALPLPHPRVGRRERTAILALALLAVAAPGAWAQGPFGPPPGDPSIEAVTPAGPANNNSPSVRGTADADTDVRIYSDSGCINQIGAGTSSLFGLVGISVSVVDDSSTTLYATATDASSSTSGCAAGPTYVEDSTTPSPPTSLSLSPSSPANNNSPTLTGDAEPDSTVTVYDGASCFGAVVATLSAADFASPGAALSVTDGSTTSFSAAATDAAGNASACSSSVTYIEDSTAPDPPADLSLSPTGPADENSPTLTGAAEEGSTVDIYENYDCTDPPDSTVSAAELAAGAHLSVADNTTTTFSANATDAAGNTSDCSGSVTYEEDSRDHVAPSLNSVALSPSSPANDNSPFITGTAEDDSTVSVYAGDDCLGLSVAGGSAADFGTTGFELAVEDDTVTTFRVTATDLAGNTTSCLDGGTYTEDSSAPAAPSDLTFTPTSPANNNSPTLTGAAEDGSTVTVYPTSDCSDTEVTTLSAADFASTGASLSVGDDSTTWFSATATDAAGNTSGCSSSATYTEDSVAPSVPASLSLSPTGPADENHPTLTGSAEDGSTVTVYPTSDCTGTAVTTLSAADFASTGAALSVGDNTVTSFSATATDAAGNPSACSSSVTYTEDSSAPAAPTGLTFTPTSPANNSSPTLTGTAEPGSTVTVYQGTDCAGTVVTTLSAAAFATTGVALGPVDEGSTTPFAANTTDAAGHTSGCSGEVDYTEDSSPPTAPALYDWNPDSPANDTTPKLVGSTDADTTVQVYRSSDCSSPLVAVTEWFQLFRGVIVSVPPDTTTTFSATATDRAGNVSGCSNGFDYVENSSLSVAAGTGRTARVSVDSSAQQASGASSEPSTSSDGRYVAFTSAAANLVALDTNGVSDVFVRDNQTGTTTRESAADDESQFGDASDQPSISADGNRVAFRSQGNIYVRDRGLGTTTPVTTGANGASGEPSISGDGNFVAFTSAATNLVIGDTNGDVNDILVADLQDDSIELASAGSDDSSDQPSISFDGRYVAFRSASAALIADDSNSSADVFVRDRQADTTERVSVATGGGQAGWYSLDPSISADGRFVAFTSPAGNLVGDDGNGQPDVFVRDRDAGTTERVDRSYSPFAGNEANGGPSSHASISADGRYVAFESGANNLVSGDANSQSDVFRFDRLSVVTQRMSVDADGTEANGVSALALSRSPAISGNGRLVAFASDAPNLVADDTNATGDVFLSQLAPDRPSGLSTDPASPAHNTSPKVTGTAPDGTTVRLHHTNNCSDTPVAEGSAADFASPGIPVSVDNDSVSSYWATATDSDGLTSACTEQGVSYVEDSTPPELGSLSFAPSSPANHNAPRIRGTGDTGTANVYAGGDCSGTPVATGTNNQFDAPGFAVSVDDDSSTTFSATITDAVGLVSTCRSATYVEDSTAPDPPALTDTDPVSPANFRTPRIKGTAEDGSIVSLYRTAGCTGARAAHGSAATFGSTGLRVTVANDSTTTFYATAKDAAGNESDCSPDGVTYVADSGLPSSLTHGGRTEQISVDSDGVEGDGYSARPSVSGDGRFVTFDSASVLVGGDDNGFGDVYLRDRLTGTTERVSLTDGGGQAVGGDSLFGSISDDGRMVAFDSEATNLDSNGERDVFVRDRQSHTTTQVSVADGGAEGDSGSYLPRISADGRYVAFASDATNLDPSDGNSQTDIYMRDLESGTTALISANPDGNAGDSSSSDEAISADGRYVAFDSSATDLLPDGADANGTADIFVRDTVTETTQLVSVSGLGAQSDDYSEEPSISADGRYVAFTSYATNLAGNPGGYRQVFVHDRQTGDTFLVSRSAEDGAFGGNADSSSAAISPDGHAVAFVSAAGNLMPGDTGGHEQTYVRDLVRGVTERVSLSTDGEAGDADSHSDFSIALSSDGRFVAYGSDATNLVPGDDNDSGDVFGRVLGPVHPSALATSPASPADDNSPKVKGTAASGSTVRVYTTSDCTGSPAVTGSAADFASPGLTVSVADDSSRTFYATASDGEGNESDCSTDSVAYVEDSTTPNAPANLGLSPGPPADDNFPVLTGIAETGTTVKVYPTANCTGTAAATLSAADFSSPGAELSVDDDTTTSFSATATDAAGHTSACSDAVTYVEDSTAEIPDITASDPGSPANDATPKLKGTAEAGSAVRIYRSASCGGAVVGRGSAARFSSAGLIVAAPADATTTYTAQITDALEHVSECSDGFSYTEDPALPVPDTHRVLTRDSVASDGSQGNSTSYGSSLSATGRYVAFDSFADNLVADDTNNNEDVFLRDRKTGAVELISVTSDGAQSGVGQDVETDLPKVSGDGRYVAFESDANDLVPGDTNDAMDVFLRDRQAHTTVRVSVASNGTEGGDELASRSPSISADGRYVTFQSESALASADTDDGSQIYLRDVVAGTTTLVSATSGGTPADDFSDNPSISADGRYVAYRSTANNLVAGIDDGDGERAQIYLWDRLTGATVLASRSTSGDAGGDDTSSGPSVSADGHYVAFSSYAENLVAGELSDNSDIFVFNRLTGTTQRVSVTNAGAQISDGHSAEPAISGDGQRIVFSSDASSLVAGDTNGRFDVFVRDLQANTTERVSVDADGGQASGHSYAQAISSDGRRVSFASRASDLVPEDTNDDYDVFVRSLTPVDTTAPDAPAALATTPASPANDNAPKLTGTAEAGSTVDVYTSADCSGSPVVTGTAADFAAPGLALSVADDSSTSLSVTATDIDDNVSACSSTATYDEDSIAPSAPTALATTPGSPADDNAPKVHGTAASGATVKLYTTADCSGAPAATGTAAAFGSPGLAASVTDNSSTTFKATATDAAGNTSDCSSGVTYLEVTGGSSAPSAPSLTGTTPGSPANANSPSVIGTAPAGSTVRLYTTADCSGTPTAGGTAAGLASPGIEVSVPDDSTTTFKATATISGTSSPCSSGLAYVEDSTAPAAPAITGGPTGSTTSTTATFPFTGEAGGAFGCALDGATFAGCTSPKAFTGLVTGAHSFAVRQTDAAGNTGPAMTAGWTVAAGPPDGSSDDTPVDKDTLTVDCVLPDASVETCTVDLFADTNSRRANAAARELIGTGTGKGTRGQRTIPVVVTLNKRGKLVLAAHPEGLTVTIKRQIKPFDSTTIVRTSEKVVILASIVRFVPTAGQFSPGSARLSTAAKRYLARIFKAIGPVSQVRCHGFTDTREGASTARARHRLGTARAKAVCAQLKKLGMTKHTVSGSYGPAKRRASNRTARGRALNRRVELTIFRTRRS